MRNYFQQIVLATILLLFIACSETPKEASPTTASMPVYKDVPYLQDYSIKYVADNKDLSLKSAFMDRNLLIQIASSDGILRTHDGQFLYPGILMKDKTYRPLTDKNITAIETYRDQFIYLDDKAVLSNAWAGSLYLQHSLPKAHILSPGKDFGFLISDGQSLQYVSKDQTPWKGNLDNESILTIKFDEKTNLFWILGKKSITSFDPSKQVLTNIYQGNNLTALALFDNKLIVGTLDGYLELDPTSGKQIGEPNQKLPWTEITYIEAINGNLWFGSTKGAFMQREDGKFNYYYGK